VSRATNVTVSPHCAVWYERRLMFRFVPLLFLVACAVDATDDADWVSTDVPDETDLAPKADQPEITSTPVDGLALRSSIGRTEEGRVIRSASAFRAAFTGAPPADLDFDTEWLAVYSAGVQTTGGYKASILSVRLSDSGKTVKVTSKIEKPGTNCIVTQSLTKPVAVVRFAAQPSAHTSRFTKLRTTRSCGSVCGADLTSLLTTTTQGMLFPSESDFPLEVVSFGMQGAPTVAKLRTLTSTPASEVAEQRSFATQFDNLTTAFDPNDPVSVENAHRYQMLRDVLETNLTDLTVIRFSTIHIDVYIAGQSACGELIAIKTVSIET
jgi:nuclease A inhibitor-like protein/protease stability complex PrcB-like protein